MQSPIAALRNSKSLTQDAFAQQLGMSKGALLRYEQATPTSPSLTFKTALNLSPNEWHMLLRDYDEYQEFKRSEAGPVGDSGAGGSVLDPEYNFPKGPGNPFTCWRAASNNEPTLTAVAVAYCIHIPTLQKLEPAPNVPVGIVIPPTVINALTDAGHYPVQLTLFKQAWEWFRWHQDTNSMYSLKAVGHE